jgi:bifunctional non-homologous end joining protein LigD
MTTLPKIEPMELIQQATPFDHDEWMFEVKHDGFRAVAYIEHGLCTLVSRNDHNYRRFAELRAALPQEINATDAIIDGEVVVLDRTGKSQFHDLMSGRGIVVFAAFDLMWLNGEDIRDLTAVERKEILRFRLRHESSRVMFVDFIEAKGKALFDLVCERDMEGIVCKPMISPYWNIRRKTTWIKVKNPKYSQAIGRADLFNKRRS